MRRTKVITYICVIAWAANAFAQHPVKTWTRAVNICATADGRQSGLMLHVLDQQQNRLVGVFGYVLAANATKISGEPIVLEGFETKTGAFWPVVELQAKDKQSGRWQTIAKQAKRKDIKKIRVEAGPIQRELRVNFDPFKSVMDRYVEGRVIFLTTGEAVEFPLAFLRQDGDLGRYYTLGDQIGVALGLH